MNNKMKNIVKRVAIFAMALMSLTMTSCLKDDALIEWDDAVYVLELPYTKHYLLKQNVKPDTQVEYDFMVNYSIDTESKMTEDIPVTLGVDESLATTHIDYKKYELLPASAYSFPTEIVITKGERLWNGKISVNTAGLVPGGKYQIPIVIKDAPDNYVVSGNFNYLHLLIKIAE